jgi:hypothetical protein
MAASKWGHVDGRARKASARRHLGWQGLVRFRLQPAACRRGTARFWSALLAGAMPRCFNELEWSIPSGSER